MTNHKIIPWIRELFKSLTLPEWLAMSRILTFPAVLSFVFLLDRNIFGLVYLILFSTDFLDGFTAWLLKNDSDRREILDTWGDNLYFLAGILGFYHFEPEFFSDHVGIMLTVFVLYLGELAMSLKKFGIPSNFHNYSAKASAFLIFIFLVWLFFAEANKVLFYAAIILCFLDVIDEYIILFSIKRWRTHIKGFWEVV